MNKLQPIPQMVTRCRFKRERTSEWEYGVAVGPDSGSVNAIITFTGEVVPFEPQIWTYERQEWQGLLWLQP